MTTTAISLLVRLREPTDREAWNRFVNLYGPMMYRWAKSTGMNSDDASDLVQDVMALLIRKLPNFEYDGSRSFRAWLKTVTLNKWREQGRRKTLPIANSTQSGLARIPEEKATDLWDIDFRRHRHPPHPGLI